MGYIDHLPPPLDPEGILSAAHGFCDLGLFLDANEELERLSHEVRTEKDVLILRARVYAGAEAWELLREVAGFLVRIYPEDGRHWIWLAHAARHCSSVEDAQEALRNALPLHGSNALIQFRLACYAALLEDIKSTRAHLTAAINLDPSLKVKALDEPELEGLW